MNKKHFNWQKVLLDVALNIKEDVTRFLSYILSVTVEIALLYYIMKILGEFAIFVFEKNGIVNQQHLDFIPVLLWCFGLVYIVSRNNYRRKC